MTMSSSTKPITEKEKRRKLIRREQSRRKQQTYRDRKKMKEKQTVLTTRYLHGKINRITRFMDVLMNPSLLSNDVEFRQLLLSVYLDYFEFGADPQQTERFEAQRVFLDCMFSKDCMHPRGYEPVLRQWRMLGTSHADFVTHRPLISNVGRNNTFTVRQEVEMVITATTIATIYPHMQYDRIFMRSVIRKVLKYSLFHFVRFNAQNQVESLTLEHQLAQGWMDLLEDPILTAQVMSGVKIDHETTFITADLHHSASSNSQPAVVSHSFTSRD